MSAQAIAIVEKCLETKDPYLDLGNCGLTDADFKKSSLFYSGKLDTLLRKCDHITKLILSNKWEEWSNGKRQSKKSKNSGKPNVLNTHPPALLLLTTINCLACGGEEEGRWHISRMDFVSSLTQLQTLYLGYNNIMKLEGLDQLAKLQYFNISNNHISELKGLDQLAKLQFFYIPNNQISELKGLDQLANLQFFYISDNQISELKGLDQLANLQFLDLSNNQISKLKYLLTLKPFIENKLRFYFDENPLTNPPMEIYKQGREAIINYFEQIAKEDGRVQYLFEAKLLVIGEGGSGKTSFIKKIQDVKAVLPDAKDTTLGIDVSKWSYGTGFNKIPDLDKITFHVNLWDFGGQKIYQGTHQIFFYDKSLYVLVADTREQKTDFAYWLNTVEQLGGEKSILLVVLNKKYGHEVKFDEGYKLHFRDIIKEVISLDLKDDSKGLLGLQEKVKWYLKQLDGIGDPLPPSWVKIREALAAEKGNFISFDRFRDICKQYEIIGTSMIQTLSGYYNRIGAITHYIDDKVLQNRVFLNSNWLVKTVYKVIDSDIAKNQMGSLSEADVRSMWQHSELDFEIPQLTELMHKFGLMYHVPQSDKYVIPAHLPESQPYSKWKYADAKDLLHFQYEFEKYMPQGILSHVIVLLHKFIYNDIVWHKGVNVSYLDTVAEIKESLGGKNAFEISITGFYKRELLAIIRERFAEVFQPYKNLKYEQKVPCNCVRCSTEQEKHFYDYSELTDRMSNGKQTIECRFKPFAEVSIKSLIDSVEVSSDWRKLTEKIQGKLSYGKTTAKKVFISYSHTDEEEWKIEFSKQLIPLERCGMIEPWQDRFIQHGNWDEQIEQAMNEADIFIWLITANFTSSAYIAEKEITTAYRRFKEGSAIIVPVICSPCKWEILPLVKGETVKLGDFQAYPRDGKPISSWKSKDEGFLDVINQLERLLKD